MLDDFPDQVRIFRKETKKGSLNDFKSMILLSDGYTMVVGYDGA
jgi:hypothetical protein